MERTGLPFALVMEQDTVRDDGLDQPPAGGPPAGRAPGPARARARAARRVAVLERLLAVVPESAAVIATTGKCGRELFTLADRPAAPLPGRLDGLRRARWASAWR